MDALDLLFRRLVLSAREADALARPLDVGEVIDRFAPYRMARRDGLIESNDDYLHVVMRLVAGERSLVYADDLLQDDLKAELASPNPDLTLLRTYLNTKIRLATAEVQKILDGDTQIDLRAPTPATAQPAVVATPPVAPVASATAPAPAVTSTARPGCPYCSQPLPEGRILKFCPSCGLNLLTKRCSGCSAEIETGWKFCVICGRSAA
ncbi:MAG: zinc ribbon domain-containing protein [Gemmatimonadaceae bacterium]